MRTSEAVWLTGLPALFFVALVSVFAARDPALRAGLTPQAIDSLLNKWLYIAYFSVASILAYNIYEDYGAEFRSRKVLWALYLGIFVSSANTLMAMLLEEAAAWKPGGKAVTASGTMALSYTLSVIALLAYSMYREADIAVHGTVRAGAGGPSTMEPMGGLGPKLVSVLPHVKRYWPPALATVGLTCAMVFGLRADSVIAYFVSTLAMVGSVVFPLFLHFAPRE